MDRFGGAFGSLDSGSYDPDAYDSDYDDTYTDSDPPSPVGQDERRMQVRAYNHWASLLGNGTLPDIEDLEPERLDDFGPYSVLLDFSSGIENPAVRFIGSELREECDAQGIIDRLSDVPPRSLLSRITDHYMQILANQAPIGFEAEYVNQRDATVLYRGILLPYSSDDETIDFIFGVINWKETADAGTTDELLLEIDQALGAGSFEDTNDVYLPPLETPETLLADASGAAPGDDTDREDVLHLSAIGAQKIEPAVRLPKPRFGMAARLFGANPADAAEIERALPSIARRERGIDALGNPLGAALDADDEESDGADAAAMDGMATFEDDGYDSSMKTAADYGLPDWDDEPEDEDVDALVDPLADDESESSLISLVNRGEKTKKAVDLGAFGSPSVPQAYEPDDESEEYQTEGLEFEDPWADARASFDELDGADSFDGRSTAPAAPQDVEASAPEPIEAAQADPEDTDLYAFDAEPAGLYDCLAQARELAQAAQNTEDRSRKALYAAVGRAYDFSLEATSDPEGFDEIMADNGLTMQDRAPMTPVVKLVFGSDYDKTRLTEYAAVLTHAHRVQVERGKLVEFLRAAQGGLKGIIQAERRARKEEQGKPVEQQTECLRETLAAKLRKLDGMDFSALGVGGPEFALVMVRRDETGRLCVLGELPQDRGMLEKAARSVLAR